MLTVKAGRPVRWWSIAAVIFALTALAACTKGGGEDGGACQPLAAACSAPADCCSGTTCTGNVCVEIPQCAPLAAACAQASDCCSGACSSQVCIDPNACKALDVACAGASECCTGACTSGHCAVPMVPGQLGDPCSANEACASGRCDGTKCVSSDFCQPVDAACSPTRPTECCTGSCTPDATGTGGHCAVAACKSSGVQCTEVAQCCSGLCSGSATTSGACQPVPAGGSGFTCKTLGDSCGAGTDCCSKNCKGGACVQAYSCQAYGDICYEGTACCSGLCDATGGAPGRCIDPPGGCVQGGNPSDNASGCCSRLLKDMGTGVKVCVPAGGCRMTDEYCDGSGSCCGSSGGYGVYCDLAGKTAPDSGSHDDYRCSKGQSCNPPGNICGVTTDVNASQNCCIPGDFNGSGKAVCKPDTNGVYRCYGSPPGGGTGTPCPTGYDSANPACCIATGNICQFKDQCCGGEPCVPDGAGVLRCTAAAACKDTGTTCDGASDTTCCSGPCTYLIETGWKCSSKEPPVQCSANGAACTASGDCCSRTCDAGKCTDPCLGSGGACTTGADCCSGLGCAIPSGATSGTCESSGPAPSCAQTGGACSVTTPCCDSAESCSNGTCLAANTCGAQAHACTNYAGCCDGLLCFSSVTDTSGTHLTACPPGGTCACEVPPATYCVPTNQACAVDHPCCFGVCASTATRTICDGTTPCTCITAG
jgi:hypothetical protein